MTLIKLKYVQAFTARGRRFYYFRRPGSPRLRLPGIPGSAEFMAAYEAALSKTQTGVIEIGASRTRPGSVNSLIVAYYSSAVFTTLSQKKRTYRRNVIEAWRAEVGNRPLALLERRHLVVRLEKFTKPHAKREWLFAIRHMMQYAVEVGLIAVDPTATIKVKAPKSDGFLTWAESHIEAYRARHPIGTMARLALELFLNTAQRRSDVLHMGRQHIRNGMLQVKQRKTGIQLTLPILPDLAGAIDAMPTGNMTFLTREGGQPFTDSTLGKWFREQCIEASLQGYTAHGLRKAACRRLAEAGCTAHEIAAFSGHLSLAEVTRYTREADRARMAVTAAAKLGTSSVKPRYPKVSNRLKGKENS
jgi:integrase